MQTQSKLEYPFLFQFIRCVYCNRNTKYTVRHNNLLPYNSALHVSAHQNLHQAPLLQKFQKHKYICNMQTLPPSGRSPAEMVGSNPAGGRDVCLL